MSIKTTLFKTDPKAITPLLLRILLGVVFFVHGSQKLFAWWGGNGLDGFSSTLVTMGLTPGMFWAILVALTEFIGGILLVLGLLTRVAALLVAVVMLVAIWKLHLGAWSSMEFPLSLLVISLALLGIGGGALSVDSKIGHTHL